MTDTAVLPGTAVPAPGSGSGGPGWIDDDGPDGWWGWSEEPADDEPPYRGSRVRRFVAVVTAVAVVAGSMTLVAVVAVGPPTSQYAVGVVHMATSAPLSGHRTAVVHFTVTNSSQVPRRATCRVLVGNLSSPAASATVTTPLLRSGATVAETVTLHVARPLPAGAAVRCGAARRG